MHPSPHARVSPRLYLQLVSVSVIWGGTFIAGRLLSGAMPALLTASLRFLLASAALLLFLALSRTPLRRPTARQWLQLLLLGFFGIFVYNVCFFNGLRYVNASRASLIVALNPAMIALACFFLFREKLSAAKLAGIALCLAGAGLVIVSKDSAALHGGHSWLGDGLILGCVLSWVIYSVFSRSLSQAIGPLLTVCYSILLGTLLLCLATWANGDARLALVAQLSLPQWLSLLYLGVLGSALAYIWYYDGIRQIGATRSGVFIALNPMTAVLCGALLLGEQLSTPICVGGALIVLGIYLSNRQGARARAAAARWQSESA